MHALAPAALRLVVGLPGQAVPLLRHVAFAALQGALFVVAVWVICRLAPRLPTRWRCMLWWLASLKLVLGLLWPAPLPLRVLPPSFDAPPTRGAPTLSGPPAASPAAPAAASSITPSPITPSPITPSSITPSRTVPSHTSPSAGAAAGLLARWWAPALAAAWLLGVAFQLGAMAREWWMLRQLLKRTQPVQDQALRDLAAGICGRLGLTPVELRLAPEPAPPADPVRENAPRRPALPAPLVARALRPVVVLPATGLACLSPEEAAMTLCHELMHVRRRDLLWGWMPAIATRLFFFLPLARWAAREYALAREAACDNAVLRHLGAAPVAYGRLLLRLAVAPPSRARAATEALRWPAVTTIASATAALQQLRRRLELLQLSSEADEADDAHSRPRRPRRRAGLGFAALGLLASTALVPLGLASAPRSCPKSRAHSPSSSAHVLGLPNHQPVPELVADKAAALAGGS